MTLTVTQESTTLNLTISTGGIGSGAVDSVAGKTGNVTLVEADITDFGTYQDELVSGTNIKTINGESLLGSTDITVSGSMTDAEVKTAYENNADTNAFTDTEKTNLSNAQLYYSDSPIKTTKWIGTQAEYDIKFPAGHGATDEVIILDAATTPLDAADIVNTPSGNLVATTVQGDLNELQSE